MKRKSSTASQETSFVASSTKNLDLTLSLEIPLAPSGSPSSCLNISLGPVKIPLGTCTPPGPISGVFTEDSLIGNSPSPDTTGDLEP